MKDTYQKIVECPNIFKNGIECDKDCPECSGTGVHGIPTTKAALLEEWGTKMWMVCFYEHIYLVGSTEKIAWQRFVKVGGGSEYTNPIESSKEDGYTCSQVTVVKGE